MLTLRPFSRGIEAGGLCHKGPTTVTFIAHGGELCLNRAKPGETLVEAHSDSDVQIDHEIWV